MTKYAEGKGRKIKVVNLDPTAGVLPYENPVADIRDKISMAEYTQAEKSAKHPGGGFEHIIR